MTEHSKQSAESLESAFRLESRPMPTASQNNAIATTLLKLKRQIDRLPEIDRIKIRKEAIRQLLVQNLEDVTKVEQTKAHK